MAPLIAIKDLNHSFGKSNLRKQVLHNINLAIDPGEIVIMTGPSGSGKTTLLTLIGALRSVQEGSLTMFGQEVKGASNQTLVQLRRTIGYIFQGHNLLPFLTARQNVRMSLALGQHSDSRHALKKVDAVLNAVGLGDHLNAHPDKLSGGQKQRVAIARALVNEPALLLADEPTASLDSKTGRDVVELMYGLAKNQRCTILLVTHDTRILDIADRTIHLEDGRLQPTEQHSAQLLEGLLSLQQLDSGIPFPSAAATPNANGCAFVSHIPQLRKALDADPLATIRETVPAVPTVGASVPIDDSNNRHQTVSIACIGDSAFMLPVVKVFLSDELFSVVLIDDPIRALTELIKVQPDLMMLDLTMPGMDSFQMCKLIRSHPLFTKTPIILIVGESKSIDLATVQSVGANDYLTKPFEQSELLIKLFPYLRCSTTELG